MNRLEATYAVGDIIEQQCRNCDRREKMDDADAKYALLQAYCINDCPVGKELQGLNSYFGGPLRKYKSKNSKERAKANA